jgi:DNA polymerase III delta prime subunit
LLDWNSFYSNAATLSIADLKEIQKLARYKHDVPDIYLIDELHRATDRIQDLLVTMLEDGNANYCIIFCTLYPERVEAQLLQRLISFEVTPPRTDEMIRRLKGICMRESWPCPDSVLANIAEANNNVPRTCENALFQWSLTIPVEPRRAA